MSVPIAVESARARRVVAGVSLLVLLLVALSLYALPGGSRSNEPGMLSTLNAWLNAAAATCLVCGFVFVRQGKLKAHKIAMLSAFGISAIFLVTYLIHHAQVGSVPFRGQGLWRVVYFSLLIPHIILAAAVVPLALLTIYRGLTDRVAAHKRLARFALPIWLFVSVSGVLVYLMLYRLPITD